MERGDVWWCDLPDPAGSESGYRRPVVVVQDNFYNASRLKTIVVVPLTTNRHLADIPGNVSIPAGAAGLPKPSVAAVHQLHALDRDLLSERLGKLPRPLVHQIELGLSMLLSLPPTGETPPRNPR